MLKVVKDWYGGALEDWNVLFQTNKTYLWSWKSVKQHLQTKICTEESSFYTLCTGVNNNPSSDPMVLVDIAR